MSKYPHTLPGSSVAALSIDWQFVIRVLRVFKTLLKFIDLSHRVCESIRAIVRAVAGGEQLPGMNWRSVVSKASVDSDQSDCSYLHCYVIDLVREAEREYMHIRPGNTPSEFWITRNKWGQYRITKNKASSNPQNRKMSNLQSPRIKSAEIVDRGFKIGKSPITKINFTPISLIQEWVESPITRNKINQYRITRNKNRPISLIENSIPWPCIWYCFECGISLSDTRVTLSGLSL